MTPLGYRLHAHMAYAFASAIVLLCLVVKGWMRTRMVLFTFFLLLQCVLVGCILGDGKFYRYGSVGEMRSIQSETKAKLFALAFAMFLAPLWWLFEVVREAQGNEVCPSCEPAPFELHHFLLAVGMLLHYLALFFHMVYLGTLCGRRLVLSALRPTKLWPSRFDELPADAAERFDDSSCSICLCDYEADDVVIVLPCGHVFHMDCCTEWVRKADLCPFRCD
eukprot:CAMPEP_0198595296 /NCGR_PEP_ID=MMETSP1462-20131121/141732_1 /TAXON_ID=1333877 /ORGANISM="Brandtodinium nutriculum, Strain RCC3387" /LENGTH=220 /DNA_ID=CAMNT_0044326931 /DNA_START=52 /DNA_END=711 /DNA_ORIENTATION=+